jgi:hypothetical protein
MAYDPASATWPAERGAAQAELAALHEKVTSLEAECTGLREAAPSTPAPALVVPSADPVITAPPPEGQ